MDDRSTQHESPKLERLGIEGEYPSTRVPLRLRRKQLDSHDDNSSVCIVNFFGICDCSQIDPSKRHIDKSTVANFWRELESWIAMHKPHLSY